MRHEVCLSDYFRGPTNLPAGPGAAELAVATDGSLGESIVTPANALWIADAMRLGTSVADAVLAG